eukprot:Amastigsp_a1867_206.p3 type:complete len:104 gc:universal Amastigsp_a1867_206:623-312(-)
MLGLSATDSSRRSSCLLALAFTLRRNPLPRGAGMSALRTSRLGTRIVSRITSNTRGKWMKSTTLATRRSRLRSKTRRRTSTTRAIPTFSGVIARTTSSSLAVT